MITKRPFGIIVKQCHSRTHSIIFARQSIGSKGSATVNFDRSFRALSKREDSSPCVHDMPCLRLRGGNGERRSRAHGVARSHVAYYTKFRRNEITARTKSTAAQSAAQTAAESAAMVAPIQHDAYTVNHIRKGLTLLFQSFFKFVKFYTLSTSFHVRYCLTAFLMKFDVVSRKIHRHFLGVHFTNVRSGYALYNIRGFFKAIR